MQELYTEIKALFETFPLWCRKEEALVPPCLHSGRVVGHVNCPPQRKKLVRVEETRRQGVVWTQVYAHITDFYHGRCKYSGAVVYVWAVWTCTEAVAKRDLMLPFCLVALGIVRCCKFSEPFGLLMRRCCKFLLDASSITSLLLDPSYHKQNKINKQEKCVHSVCNDLGAKPWAALLQHRKADASTHLALTLPPLQEQSLPRSLGGNKSLLSWMWPAFESETSRMWWHWAHKTASTAKLPTELVDGLKETQCVNERIK